MIHRYKLRQNPTKTKKIIFEETSSQTYDTFQMENYNFTTPIITIEEHGSKRRRTFQTPLPPQDIHDNDPEQWAYWTIPDPVPAEDLQPEFDFDAFLFGNPELQDYHHVNDNALPNIIEE